MGTQDGHRAHRGACVGIGDKGEGIGDKGSIG